jgi:RNA polymerase sigma-70 factor (ECF subfamily)
MDKTQFVSLIQEYQKIIHKICHLYRDSKEDREDLFQEITFQLWKAFPSFKNQAKISTWIYRIALNTAIAAFRKNKPVIDYVAELPDMSGEQPGDAFDERQERLFLLLKKLDDNDKMIIALYLEGLNYQQMAEIAGINENYVGVKLNRIKTKIQTLNKSYGN